MKKENGKKLLIERLDEIKSLVQEEKRNLELQISSVIYDTLFFAKQEQGMEVKNLQVEMRPKNRGELIPIVTVELVLE